MKNLQNVPEKLTLENFWSQLYQDSGGELQHFCDWVDEYKKRVGWDQLFMPPKGHRPEAHKDHFFNVGLAQRQALWDKRKIKFHDLPIGMQIGIVLQYFEEDGIEFFDSSISVLNFEDILQYIRGQFIHKRMMREAETRNQE